MSNLSANDIKRLVRTALSLTDRVPAGYERLAGLESAGLAGTAGLRSAGLAGLGTGGLAGLGTGGLSGLAGNMGSAGADSVTSMVKSAVISKVVGFLMIASAVALLAWGAYTLFRKYFPQLIPNSKSVGDACKESFECIGYKDGDGPACCGPPNKTCTQKVKDLRGNWYCPEEATGQKLVGETCKESFECKGYKDGDGPACCGPPGSKKCTEKVKDLRSNWYCPEEATGQKLVGETCIESFECKGYKDGDGPACCGPVGSKKCTEKVKDLAGNWYCPEEATGQKPVGASCRISNDCKGYKVGDGPACCNGVCTEKKKDWAGSWYCPNECAGAFGAKPGTC